MIDVHNFRALALHFKQGAGIEPRYLAMALEEEGKRVRFSRSNRAQTITAAQATITAAPAQKQAILQKYL